MGPERWIAVGLPPLQKPFGRAVEQPFRQPYRKGAARASKYVLYSAETASTIKNEIAPVAHLQ